MSKRPPRKPLEMLKQRYLILAQRAQGGFGTVYQAEDSLLGLSVALKEIREPQAEAIGRLRYEASLLASLKHRSIPSFLDVFEEHGRWYLAMEWVEGVHISGKKPLPVHQVLWFGEQVCEVLSYLHTRHPAIVHRDIKPDNLLLTHASHLYLLDFGISAPAGAPGQAIGSTGYAAPEQIRVGEPVTPRSDVYSLGRLLRQLVSGLPPDAATPASLACREQAASAREVEEDLLTLCESMTDPIAAARPDIEEVWSELGSMRERCDGA